MSGEKDSGVRSRKPTKIPTTVLLEWKKIVESINFETNHPIITSLKQLVNSQDKPVNYQLEKIKDIEKRARLLSAGDNTELNQIRPIILQFALIGYFNITDFANHFFIRILSNTVGNNADIFEQHYSMYLTNLLGRHTLVHKMSTISSMLEFNLGKETISSTLFKTLEFFVDCFEDRVAKWEETTESEQTELNHVIKTTFVLMSHFKNKLSNKLRENFDPLDSYIPLLVRLMTLLYQVGLNVDKFGRDIVLVSSLALCALMNLADNELAREWIVGLFFDKSPSSSTIHSLKSLGFPTHRIVSGYLLWDDDRTPFVVPILRNLVTTLRKDILLGPVPSDMHLCISIEANMTPQSMLHLIFLGIQHYRSRPPLDPYYKIVAFDALAVWLQEAIDLVRSDEVNQTESDCVLRLVQPAMIETIMQHVWDYWNDPVDVVQQKIRIIFEHLVDLSQIVEKSITLSESHRPFNLKLLEYLLSIDWENKMKYTFLSILVTRESTSLFLEMEPELLWKCLQLMNQISVFQRIKEFVMAFLYKRIEESVPGFSKFNENLVLRSEDAASKAAINEWINLWCTPILRCLTSPCERLRKTTSDSILKRLLKICPQAYTNFLNILENAELVEWHLLGRQYRLYAYIILLGVGRSLNIVKDLEADASAIRTLNAALFHVDAQVRIEALGIICESPRATAPITKTEMDLVMQFLPLNMTSTLPDFRQRLCSYLKKFITRLFRSSCLDYRRYKSQLAYNQSQDQIKDLDEITRLEGSLTTTQDFIRWLVDLVLSSMYPGSSFQRTSTSLNLLGVIIKIFGVTELPITPEYINSSPELPFRNPIVSPKYVKILLETLASPYEVNRLQAYDILCQLPSPLPGIESKEDAQQLLFWGFTNSNNVRAAESAGGATITRLIFKKYITELGYNLYPSAKFEKGVIANERLPAASFVIQYLELLNRYITVAKTDIYLASAQYPLHGTFLSLRYIFTDFDYIHPVMRDHINEWRTIFGRTLSLIRSICETTLPVLSDPSPEGNIPDSVRGNDVDDLNCNDEQDDEGVISSTPKHQAILSYCWRAVKEACALLDIIISKTPLSSQNSDKGFMTVADLLECGSILHMLLTNIRHRGAFSAVYPAYVSLNTRLLASFDEDISSLPGKWLKDNISSLNLTKTSVTRRSAGLPLCILAIVSSEKSPQRKLLQSAMTQLMDMASVDLSTDADQKTDLPQVHALNTVRTIFLDSKLGAPVLEYVSDGFLIAIKNFSSSSWAVRNCAVMLFSALIQRTFGPNNEFAGNNIAVKISSREFFTRFPSLYQAILDELKFIVKQLLSHKCERIHPGLYPILTLLSRTSPLAVGDTDDNDRMRPFVTLIMSCAASSLMKTREMAAKALLSLIPLSDIPVTLVNLFSVNDSMSQNIIHGRFLQAYFMIKEHTDGDFLEASALKNVYDTLQSTLEDASRLSNMAQRTLLETANTLLAKNSQAEKKYLNNDFVLKVAEYCWKVIRRTPDNISPGIQVLRESAAHLITCIFLRYRSINFHIDDIMCLLDDNDYEVRARTLDNLLEYCNGYDQVQIQGSVLLQQKLLKMTYNEETNQSCFILAAQLLVKLRPLTFSTDDQISLQDYWNGITMHMKSTKSSVVIESILPLLGVVLVNILNMYQDSNFAIECFHTWLTGVNTYSQSEMTLSFRESSIESIEYVANFLFDDIAVSQKLEDGKIIAIFRVIQLLQDDDEDIRNTASRACSKAMHLEISFQPERVLQIIHHRLCGKKNPSTLFHHFIDVLAGGHDLYNECLEDLSSDRLLFAKENPNVHKEDLLEIQLTYASLCSLYYTKRDDFMKSLEAVGLDVKRLINQLRGICELVESQSRIQIFASGPSGVTSRPVFFSAFYRSLLLLQIIMIYLEEHKSEENTDIIKGLYYVLKKFRQEQLHPLLWNALRENPGIIFKIKHFLGKLGDPLHNMFLLTPDILKIDH